MNNVQLHGNLATDVRLRKTKTDKDVASFKLAVNRPGKDAGADFIWVKVWNGSAVACEKYLAKGSPVLVEGSISTSRTGEAPNFTEYVEVSAQRVTFLSSGNGGNGNTPSPESEADATAKAIAEAKATLAALEANAEVSTENDSTTEAPVPAIVEDDDIPF